MSRLKKQKKYKDEEKIRGHDDIPGVSITWAIAIRYVESQFLCCLQFAQITG